MKKVKLGDLSVDITKLEDKYLSLLKDTYNMLSDLSAETSVPKMIVVMEFLANLIDITLSEETYKAICARNEIPDSAIIDIVTNANIRPLAKNILISALLDARPSLKNYFDDRYKDTF